VADWDAGDDVVIVGSGISGLTAAVTAAEVGLSPLVVEAADAWGGASAMSAGGVWVPVNDLMLADGVADSADEALEYLHNVLGDVGPASSPQRRQAYVDNAPRMARLLARHGFEWRRATRWPDYHTDLGGAKVGRMLEGNLFDTRRLGAAADTMRRPETIPPIPLQGGDIAALVVGLRTLHGARVGAQTVGRAALGVARNQRLVGMGQSLMAQLGVLCQRFEVPIYRNTYLRELVQEDGRITGVVVERGGRLRRIRAQHAVLLAGGGFARNEEFRRQYQPVGSAWSAAPSTDMGDVMQAGVKVGGTLENMSAAWWVPVMLPPNGRRDFVVWERSHPGSIIVDQSGLRYANESESYTDFGKHMLARDQTVPAVHSWLIIDSRHRRRYMFGGMPGGYTPRSWIRSGYLIKEQSLDDLARRCDIPAQTLRATVERFNQMARRGLDEDFGRGGTVYDNYYGDPSHKPNPNLGPLDRPPYYAVKLWPGDVGTSGGLLTDEHARVVRDHGDPIEGLYAAGNTTASVMGLRYPGPGITLGAGSTFGYIAMRHIATTTGFGPAEVPDAVSA
jgi:3-oxosteroid 1-dehydrogenase